METEAETEVLPTVLLFHRSLFSSGERRTLNNPAPCSVGAMLEDCKEHGVRRVGGVRWRRWAGGLGGLRDFENPIRRPGDSAVGGMGPVGGTIGNGCRQVGRAHRGY